MNDKSSLTDSSNIKRDSKKSLKKASSLESVGKKVSKYNIANVITFGRVIALPFLFASVLARNKEYFLISLATFILLDIVDGRLARKLKIESDLGKKLDYYVDLIVLTPANIFFFILAADALQDFLIPSIATLVTLAGFSFIVKGIGYCRFGRFPNPHLLSKMIPNIPLFLFFAAVLLEFPFYSLFYISAVLRLGGHLEEMLIYVVADNRLGDDELHLVLPRLISKKSFR